MYHSTYLVFLLSFTPNDPSPSWFQYQQAGSGMVVEETLHFFPQSFLTPNKLKSLYQHTVTHVLILSISI